MKISELIATLENIRNTKGDIEVFIFDVGSGMSGKVDSIDADEVSVDINASHMGYRPY